MVKDAAHAFDLAVESNSESIFNVSSGNATDLRAFGHLCLELVGRSPDELKFKSTTTPAVRVGYSYHKAEQFFNYKPQISLRDGLVKTLNEFE